MAKYTNIGTTAITVRGITVKPGETKELKGFANDRNLLRCTSKISDSKSKKKSDVADTKSSSSTPSDFKKDEKLNIKVEGQ